MTAVLFLAESYHPVLGGGEEHLRRLASRLAASGVECTVLTRRTESSWPEEETFEGVRVRRVPPSGAGRGGKYSMVPRVLRVLWNERRRHDLLVARGTRVLGLPALLAARALGVPVVLQPELNGEMSGEVYFWGTPLDRPAGRAVVRALTRGRNALLRDADAFVAMSTPIRDELEAAGVAPDRIGLIPHGVDTTRFRPAGPEEKRGLRAALGIDADAEVVTYTGRLLRGKGLETLLAAFGSVAARRPKATLRLVGSGEGQVLSVEGALRADAERRSLERRVAFTGRVDRVEDHLRASDVFAFPSLFEALGLSLVEAAACGLPCVGSRTGGIVDVIEDGRSGRLVTPGDTGELAAALEALLADVPARSVLGARGRALALLRFDLEQSVARYRGLFAEVTSRRRSACWPAGAPRGGAALRR